MLVQLKICLSRGRDSKEKSRDSKRDQAPEMDYYLGKETCVEVYQRIILFVSWVIIVR